MGNDDETSKTVKAQVFAIDLTEEQLKEIVRDWVADKYSNLESVPRLSAIRIWESHCGSGPLVVRIVWGKTEAGEYVEVEE